MNNTHCGGCPLYSIFDLICYTFNNDGACPCSICLMKVMICNPDQKTNNCCCPKWNDWFDETYAREYGVKWSNS
jgi:hypothetical protein